MTLHYIKTGKGPKLVMKRIDSLDYVGKFSLFCRVLYGKAKKKKRSILIIDQLTYGL